MGRPSPRWRPTTRRLTTWTAKAALPSARYDGDGAVANSGLVYLPGGRNSAGTLTKTLYVYTLATNVWSTKAALPIPSGCGASAMINGLLYVLTGCDGTSGFKARLHRYSPSSNTWTARASAPSAHGSPAVGVINGKLYVAGEERRRHGRGDAPRLRPRHEHLEHEGPDAIGPLPGGWPGDQREAVCGGRHQCRGRRARCDAGLRPCHEPVEHQGAMPTARTRLGAAVMNNQLYAVGGWATNDLAKVEQYTP